MHCACRVQPLTKEQWLAAQDGQQRFSDSLPAILDQVRKGVSPRTHLMYTRPLSCHANAALLRAHEV